MPHAKRPQLATIFLRHSVGIVLALVVPMLLAGFWYLSASLTQQTLKGLGEQAFFVQALLNNQLNALADQAHAASNRLQTKPVSEWSARELALIHQMLPNAAWLGAADQTGRIQTATGDVLAGAQVSSLPWYRDALQEPHWIDRRPAWIALDTHKTADAAPYTMELGVPIHREDGSLAGVLGMVVDWTLAQKQLEKVFGEQHQDPDVSYLVLGADGEVRLSHLSARLESDTTGQLLHEIRKHKYTSGEYLIAEPAERSTGPMRNLNWTVYAIRPARGVTNAVLEVVWIGLLGVVLSLTLFSVLIHRYLRALSRKIQAHLETLVNSPESDSNTIDIAVPRELCDILVNIAITLKQTHSQRIQTDQQLAQANLNFAEIRGVIEQLPMAVAMFDRDMHYLGCSKQWQSTYLAQVENPIGLSHYDLIPTISDGWKAAHQAGLSGQHLHENHDHWVTPEGKDMWLDWVIEPWRNAQGEVGGIIIAAKDITEEEQIKRALQVSEQRFQLAMEAVNDGIVDWNPVTDELYVSTVWLRVLGLPEHTRLVRMAQLEALIHKEDRARVAEHLQQALLHVRDNHLVIDLRMQAVSGEVIDTLFRARLVRNAQGLCTRLVGTLMDRREVNRLHRELQEAWVVAQAEARSNDTKSKFLDTIAREIKNPLNAVFGFTRLIRDEVPEGPAKRHTVYLEQTVDTMNALLRDILDFADLDGGRLQLAQETFDASTLLDEIAERTRLKATDAGLAFGYVSSLKNQPGCVGDQDRIRQMVENLLSNALKFTHRGHIQLQADWLPGATDDAPHTLRVVVEDSGLGIPPDKQQQLFEPFTQLHSDMSTRFGGAGLGLTIVKALAELMHGSISVESQVNQGSRFTLLLPMKCQPQFDLEVSPTVGPRRDGPAKLLIADGDVNTLNILDSFLAQRGFDVLRAADGHAALALLLDQRFDGVLMNVRLPLLDGLGVISTVRTSKGPNQQVPALAITDHSLSAAHLQGLGECFETTVCKPLNLDTLLQWLNAHLQL